MKTSARSNGAGTSTLRGATFSESRSTVTSSPFRPTTRMISTGRRRGLGSPVDDSSDAFDMDDAGDLLQAAHHVLQLVQVRAHEREHVHRAAVVAGPTLRLADVDALLMERLADRGEDAQAVLRRHLHLDG